MKIDNILLLRTFKDVGTGGTIPPLGLLYLASSIRNTLGDINIELYNCGLHYSSSKQLVEILKQFNPNIVMVSTLSCEADKLTETLKLIKNFSSQIITIVGGPHSFTLRENLLSDKNIDFIGIGEGERTIVELLSALQNDTDLENVQGIAFRKEDGNITTTKERTLISNLDSIPYPAWDLVNLSTYSKIKNWNGILKEKIYAPICTSRGCPYNCIYCHHIFSKAVRMRSPKNIVDEIFYLYEKYNCKEFHIVDDIFNYDIERAKEICSLIINSKLKIALAFPNGLRADIMTNELLDYLKQAGTYKINYGFETSSPRLQKIIGKNLNIEKASQTLEITSKKGITTGSYFMLGLPTETFEEMNETISFAVNSRLDMASFFKATVFPNTKFHELSHLKEIDNKNLHFFASQSPMTENETINKLILIAQQKFYLNPSRIFRAFLKTPSKSKYLLNLLSIFTFLLQAFLLRKIKEK